MSNNIARIEFPDFVTIVPGALGLGWIFGDGPPSADIGRNGERYVDELTGLVWEKSAGVWSNTGRRPFAVDDAISAAQSTSEDREQTRLDRAATTSDRIQTGLDRIATGQDRNRTEENRAATAGDRAATNADRAAAEQLVTALEQIESQRVRFAVLWQTAGTVRGLSDLSGPEDGAYGTVIGPDGGTHTDPVTGLIVPNEGKYQWSAAAPGWTRLGENSDTLKAASLEQMRAATSATVAATPQNLGPSIHQSSVVTRGGIPLVGLAKSGLAGVLWAAMTGSVVLTGDGFPGMAGLDMLVLMGQSLMAPAELARQERRAHRPQYVSDVSGVRSAGNGESEPGRLHYPEHGLRWPGL